VRTVREWLRETKGLTGGAFEVAMLAADDDSGLLDDLLDALVIEPQGEGKAVVVPREAREAAICALSDHDFTTSKDEYVAEVAALKAEGARLDDAEGLWTVMSDRFDAALAALFAPGTVRVAKAVGIAFFADGVSIYNQNTDPHTMKCIATMDDGDEVAILEPEPAKEGA
jgi:hypothetical protein